MDLHQWRQENPVRDGMSYKEAAEDQIHFVSGTLRYLFARGLGIDRVPPSVQECVTVISTHRSKSIDLPVYQLTRPGLVMTLRGNFHDWKMSVESETPVEVDFTGLCHTTPPTHPRYTGDPLLSAYFEGFPEELVFGYYGPSDKKRFSLALSDKQEVWVAVFIILRGLGIIQPAKWSEPREYPKR